MDDQEKVAKAFGDFIDELGGPGQVTVAVATGLLETQIRNAAQKFFGTFDAIIPQSHPLRSRSMEKIVGVAQALARLKHHGPVVDVGHSFIDYGQKRWFNGTSADRDWIAEFEQRAHERIAQAEDPQKEAASLLEQFGAHRDFSKSIGELRSELMPDAGKDEAIDWDSASAFLNEVSRGAAGVIRSIRLALVPWLARHGIGPTDAP